MTSGSLTLHTLCVELKNQDSLYTSEHLLHYWHETRQKQTLMSLFFVTAVFRFSPVTHQLFSLFCSLLLLPSNTCSFIHFLCLRSIKCKDFYIKSFSVASAPQLSQAYQQDFQVLSTCFTIRVFSAALLYALASLLITEIIPSGEKQEGGWHFTFLWDCNCPIECTSAGCALLCPVWFTCFV